MSKKQPRLDYCEFCNKKTKIEYCHIISRVKMGVQNRGRRPVENGIYLCGHMRESGTCHNRLDLVLKTELRRIFVGKEDEMIKWWDDPNLKLLENCSNREEEMILKDRMKSSLRWAIRLKKRNKIDGNVLINSAETLLASLDLGEFQLDQK